jgi:hypothetical protein
MMVVAAGMTGFELAVKSFKNAIKKISICFLFWTNSSAPAALLVSAA